MWQPEQPSSQTVASFDFAHGCLPSRMVPGRAGTPGYLGWSEPSLALVEERSGGADLHALAAAGAGGFSPGLMQVGDDAGVDAAAHDVPDVRAFDLGADAHAAGAEDAAVVDRETKRSWEASTGSLGVAIGEADVSQTLALRQRLQFAMAVGDADRADVIALGEEHLQDVLAIVLQALGVGA